MSGKLLPKGLKISQVGTFETLTGFIKGATVPVIPDQDGRTFS